MVERINRLPPAVLADALLTLTDGNPFFVEELLQSLKDEGRLQDILQGTDLDELPVPRSVQWTIQQRAGQLPEAQRQALTYASVIGERFEFDLLQEMIGHGEEAVLEALRGLIDTRLVIQESASQFAFRHALTRQREIVLGEGGLAHLLFRRDLAVGPGSGAERFHISPLY